MAIRFCLVLEHTAAMAGGWEDIRGTIVEPILRSITAQGRCELALVLFGAHGFSPSVVQSGLWTQSVSQLRQWLDDVEFGGGGGQPVGLAEALLEAAALMQLPTSLQLEPGAPPPQAHCLVCTVSDPSTAAVRWMCHPDNGKWARVPGLITSVELVHALWARLGVTVGLATRMRSSQHISTPLVFHWLHTLVSPQVPPASVEVFVRDHQAEWRALLMRTARTAGSVALFAHWDQGLQAVLQYNNGAGAPHQLVGRGPGPASPVGFLIGDTPSPQVLPTDADTPGTAPAGNRSVTPQPAGLPTTPPLPEAAGAAMPAPGLAAAPAAAVGMGGPPGGGFMELMSMPSAAVAASVAQPVQQPAQPAYMQQQQQPAGAGPQSQQQPALPTLYQGGLAFAWRGGLMLSERIRGTTSPLLGSAELIGRADQLQHFSLAMLPPELVISKLVSARIVSADLARKNPLQMHLRVKEWSEDGEAALLRLASKGAAGMIDLLQGYTGVLLAYVKAEGGGDGAQKLSMRLAIYKA